MEKYQKFLDQIEKLFFTEDEPGPADVIFVPGNGYPQMAEKAAALYHKGLAPFVLPSGRYSIAVGHFGGVLAKQEQYGTNFETEWEFLHHVLTENGVPDQAVLKEDQATFTLENAMFSRKVTDKKGIAVRKAILCCKSCHAKRSQLYYQYAYPDTQFYVVPVDADGITRENWRETKEGVEAVTGELTRMITQFSLMMPPVK